jgi:hypothetical protein
MITPGSPKSTAPLTINSMANSVLPAPALPHISVERPWGSPPLVISSRPFIPVADFDKLGREDFDLGGIVHFKILYCLNIGSIDKVPTNSSRHQHPCIPYDQTERTLQNIWENASYIDSTALQRSDPRIGPVPRQSCAGAALLNKIEKKMR